MNLPVDPIKFGKLLWPRIGFYKEQQEVIYSVRDNDETVVPAGNMLGKDFVSAFIVLWFFLTRSPCRIVTTSADYSQLESVLWGEIRRFLQYSKYPLTHDRGGPLVVNHLHLKKIDYYQGQKTKKVCGISYVIGRVAAKGEGMLGHHVADVGDGVPRTLYMADEASGVEDVSYERADTWARRKLVIGNPYPCDNFFKKGVEEGDKPAPTQEGQPTVFYRKVIPISAECSPNVRYAMAEIEAGRKPSHKVLVPGVLPYRDWVKRRATWDVIRQCIGLDGKFYKGMEVLLYPPDWLDLAHRIHSDLRSSNRKRHAKGIGVDPGEGEANTAISVVDEFGLIEQVSRKTPDTNVIHVDVLNMMWKWRLDPERVCFDAGGGGRQIAHRMRADGYAVKTVAFGETLVAGPRKIPLSRQQRVEQKELRYTYKNRRAEMYGNLRELLDPSNERTVVSTGETICGFGLPAGYVELRKQLAPLPLLYQRSSHGEGQMYLPPKNRKDRKSKEEKTLEDIIGHSPDEADSLVIAIHAMLDQPEEIIVGAF